MPGRQDRRPATPETADVVTEARALGLFAALGLWGFGGMMLSNPSFMNMGGSLGLSGDSSLLEGKPLHCWHVGLLVVFISVQNKVAREWKVFQGPSVRCHGNERL